jgi:hypothetical protein
MPLSGTFLKHIGKPELDGFQVVKAEFNRWDSHGAKAEAKVAARKARVTTKEKEKEEKADKVDPKKIANSARKEIVGLMSRTMVLAKMEQMVKEKEKVIAGVVVNLDIGQNIAE